MLKAVGEKILVEFKKPEAPSSILLPDHVKSKINDADEVAVVLSVGDQVKEVKAGDTIVFNPDAAAIITILGTEYILLTEKGIIVITNHDREGR